MPKFVKDGALLTCDKGVAPGSLKVIVPTVKTCGAPQANKNDHVPMMNIPSFGACLAQGYPPKPCIPATSGPWSSPSSTVKVRGANAVIDSSTCSCSMGGTISVAFAGQVKVDNS